MNYILKNEKATVGAVHMKQKRQMNLPQKEQEREKI